MNPHFSINMCLFAGKNRENLLFSFLFLSVNSREYLKSSRGAFRTQLIQFFAKTIIGFIR